MLTGRQIRHVLEDADRIFQEAAYALLDVLCAQAQAAILQGEDMPALFKRAAEIYRDQLRGEWNRDTVAAASEAVRRALAESLRADLRAVRTSLDELPDWLKAEIGQSATNTVRGVSEIVWRDNLAMATAARTNYYGIVGRYTSLVNSGAMKSEQAVRRAVSALADHGVEVIDYATGVRSQADVAMRRHVRSQINQANARTTEELCLECGVEYVEVDRTATPRPSHARWEGRVYKLHGSEPGYPNFYEGTGYLGRTGPYTALGDRLAGVNCGHTFAPFYPDIDEPHYSDDPYTEAEKAERYRLTQTQRGLERSVRSWKRKAALLEDRGLDAAKERAKVGEYQRRLRGLVKAHPDVLVRDYNREHIWTTSGTQPRPLGGTPRH